MAVGDELRKKYTPTIGVECHVQLKTETKLFAGVGNDASGAQPNTLISHICVGLPGALPVLNEKALELACRAAFALNTKPQRFSKFDRKHYFAPICPRATRSPNTKTQLLRAAGVEIEANGVKKTVKITRIHMEEDAGKNTHPAGADYSLVDLNRAGTPLLEIVSEPDINSPAEAKAYARELYLLMKYADVSDCDLYLGHMRFDLNISVSEDQSQMGTRTEIKNLNSFRRVESPIAYEIDRQIEVLEKGESVTQETRGWDEAKQKTIAQRNKEEADDYRYMPEPDIPPIELTDETIEKFKDNLPDLPNSIREKLTIINIEKKVVEDLLDRPESIPPILDVLSRGDSEAARRAAFWFIHSKPADQEQGDNAVSASNVDTSKIIALSSMVDKNELSSTSARSVFDKMLASGGEPQEIAQQLNLVQVSDEGEIEKIVVQVIAENPQAAEDVKNGEVKAIGYLVGQVMAKSQGKANPGLSQEMIKKQLEL